MQVPLPAASKWLLLASCRGGFVVAALLVHAQQQVSRTRSDSDWQTHPLT
jgi:hypothetical protein